MHARTAWLGVATVLGMAAGIAVAATPAYAIGATVALVENGVLKVTAAAGAYNDIEVDPSSTPGYYMVHDNQPISTGVGCKTVQGEVLCQVTNIWQVKIDGGDKNDILGVRGTIDTVLIGGFGNDTLDGSPNNDQLYGGDGHDDLDGKFGDDVLYGGAGDDILDGDGGDDTLDGGPGADTLTGGSGFDVVSYRDSTDGVVADLLGTRGDDGGEGEGDTINSDVEGLAGGRGHDRLTGNEGTNLLVGGFGDDLLTGLDGGDQLFGEEGFDTLFGDAPRGEPGTGVDFCDPGRDGGQLFDCEEFPPE